MRKNVSKTELGRYFEEITNLKAGFESLGDHVIITDPDGVILFANSAVEKNTGFFQQEIIGKNPADLWGGHMSKEFYERMWHTIKIEKLPFVGEVKNRRKNGTEYWQELHISPILDESGNIRFFIGIEPDITDRKRRDQFRDEFISIVGHQLQNPLTAVNWVLGRLLSMRSVTEEQKKMLEEVYGQNQGLIHLVVDLLAISRITGMPQVREKIDLADGINAIIKLLQERFPKISFSFEKIGTDFSLSTNKSLALQVFTNIISNAAEYSNKDTGRVVVTLQSSTKELLFSCKDNGIGIPEAEQTKIFSRLFRASNARQAKENGTGLGLFIVKMITAHLEWKVVFESKVGSGTEFFVTMPLL